MEKLRIEDIELLGDGPQIRRYIEAHYGKLEDFYNSSNINISLKSIRTYLSRQEITSDTFKHTLVRVLGKDYNELVLSKKVQVQAYVKAVFDSIKLYKQDEDIKLFEHLTGLCGEYELSVEISMMYRARAMNEYYRNWTYRAVEWYEKAIEGLDIYDMDKYVLMIAELADICYRESLLERAEKEYQRLEAYVGKGGFSSSTLFNYYYWRGIMLNNTDRHSQARQYFNNAYEYAQSEEEKSASIMNIALTYKKEHEYNEAVTQYTKLLELYDDSNIVGRALVYNNIAMTYYELGDLKEALINVTKAMFLINFTKDLYNKLIIVHTFSLISIAKGDISACEDYMELLRDTIYGLINKARIVGDIDSLVEKITDIPMLEKFELSITELIDNSYNVEYSNELKRCMGNIRNKIIMIKQGRYNREKDHRRLL